MGLVRVGSHLRLLTAKRPLRIAQMVWKLWNETARGCAGRGGADAASVFFATEANEWPW